MKLFSKAHLIMICLACLAVLAACGPAAPEVTPTATQGPTIPPTYTVAPTFTPAPTETLAIPTSALDVTPAALPDGATPGAADPAATSAVQPPAAENPAAGGAPPDQYQYLGQDVVDGTQFLPGRTVTITWTVKNSGTTGWTTDYTLRHFSGPKPEKDVYNFTKDVPAGGTINFVVTFTTPADLGDYDLWFKLTNAAGQNFGDLDLVFTVSNNPQRITPTPAAPAAPAATPAAQ